MKKKLYIVGALLALAVIICILWGGRGRQPEVIDLPVAPSEGFSETMLQTSSGDDSSESVSLPEVSLAEQTDSSVSEGASEDLAGEVTSVSPNEDATAEVSAAIATDNPSVDEDGIYTSKEDVAAYILAYNKLPSNFITKKAAKKLGWPGGSLEEYAPGKCIGGDYFANYEGLLPEKEGREYHECDIDTLGKSKRGAKRIIYSNDGLIYYTDDHYESFELLAGEP